MNDKKRGRTFTQLQKEKSFTEFNQFVKAVTERYAQSNMCVGQSNVAKDNNITVQCLRKLMDYAIVYGIVSLEIASQVKEKAKIRANMHYESAGVRSEVHHYELYRKRAQYMLTSIFKSEIKEIAEYYANNPKLSIQEITRKYQLDSSYLTKLILEKAILENIVSDDVVELLIKRNVGENPKEKVVKYFENLRKEREENKKKNSQK